MSVIGCAQDVVWQFLNMPTSFQNQVYGHIWHISNGPNEDQWGEKHAFDSLPLLRKAIEETACRIFDHMKTEDKNHVAGRVYESYGRPDTQNLEWGMHHAKDNTELLLKSLYPKEAYYRRPYQSEEIIVLFRKMPQSFQDIVYEILGQNETDDSSRAYSKQELIILGKRQGNDSDKLAQAIVLAVIKAFNEQTPGFQQAIGDRVYAYNGSPQTSDLNWGVVHAKDNPLILMKSLSDTLYKGTSSKLKSMTPLRDRIQARDKMVGSLPEHMQETARNVIAEVGFLCKEALLGAFNRALLLFGAVLDCFGCGSLILRMLVGSDCNKLDEAMLSQLKDESYHSKLSYVFEKIKDLSQKMGIENPNLYFHSGELTAAIYSPIRSFVIVGIKDLAAMSEAEIDFMIAHELAHLHYKHGIAKFVSAIAVLAADITAAVLCSPFLIPLIEGVSAYLEQYLFREIESQADKKALEVLGTNQGAVSTFEKQIAHNLDWRNMKLEEIENHPVREHKEEYKKVLNFYLNRLQTYTPKGDIRDDFGHPSLSERLTRARSWALATV